MYPVTTTTPLPDWNTLATAVILLDQDLRVAYLNPSAENLFELSRKTCCRACRCSRLFGDAETLAKAVESALLTQLPATPSMNFCWRTPGSHSLHLSAAPSLRWTSAAISLLLEFHQIDQQLKIAREERMLDQSRPTAS